MSAKIQHYASIQNGYLPVFKRDSIAERPLTHDQTISPSTQRNLDRDRFRRELVWLLILIQLLLYLATSYLYWAKTESAWPIFR